MIGLELSLERLWLMRRLVFGLGALQLAACAAALTGAGVLLGRAADAAAVIGLALAMSSTAIVLQVLAEEKRLGTPAGRASFAILLFQDLAVVPVLFALAALDPESGAGSLAGFGRAIAHALLAVAGIAVLGRLVLRPLFRSVARTNSEELFVAACLLVVIATALATAAAGLSMALGALIGGLSAGRHRIPPPGRGDDRAVQGPAGRRVPDVDRHEPRPARAGRASGDRVRRRARAGGAEGCDRRRAGPRLRPAWRGGVQTALLLGPGGEFSFVIVTVALATWLVDDATAGLVLLVAALTMVGTPLLSKLGVRLAPRSRPALVRPGAAGACQVPTPRRG